ncbi:MAG: hypothetical protein AAGG46_00705 [Planctomycetota bacterium]
MMQLLKTPPVQITMNDGESYVIESADQALCGSMSVAFLQLYDDGKYRHVHLPYVTMASVVTIAPTA